MDIYEEFLQVIDALNAADVDYAVCGGIALAIHGRPRFTRDIDFLILSDSWEAVRQALAPLGYAVMGGPIPFDVGKPTARELLRLSKPMGPDADLLTLDFLLVAPSLEDVWAERELYAWNGRTVKTVSRQGLGTMKRLAGRPQDIADLGALEAGSD